MSAPRSRRARGFTLLEVLVAVAVLALGLAAAARVVQEQAAQAARLRAVSLAHWAALNQLTAATLPGRWPAPTTRRGEVVLGARRWHWTERVSTTPEPDVRRVEVSVGADANGPVLARRVAFVSRGR